MGTRTIDMSSCPCCCDMPDYIELSIDYGSTCMGYLEGHQPGGIPIDCNEVLGSYYTSAGLATVQLQRVARNGKTATFRYDGQAGALIQAATYTCDASNNVPGLVYLTMNYVPTVPSYIPYTDGGPVTWPAGYCVSPNATVTAHITQTISAFSFELSPFSTPALKDNCHCYDNYSLEGAQICCESGYVADYIGLRSYGVAKVTVSSNGVCLTEAAWDASTPCMPWSSMGMTASPSNDCPNSVICAGGDWLYATLWAAVKVHVKAIRL